MRGRYGCCDAGSYMANPELNPFVKANACQNCPANRAGSAADNDDTSCCALVADGTCTACNSLLISSCTAVICNAGFYESGSASNNLGCSAYDVLPNGDGSSGNPGTGLRKVVSDWLSGGTAKDTVVAKYGPIEDWNVESVTSLYNVFYQKGTFNADISMWNTAAVTTMRGSTSSSPSVSFVAFFT
jgi:hypothetical protein